MKCRFTAIIISALFFSSSVISLAQGYADIPSNHWGYDSISEFSNKGYINGYNDNTFRPSSSMTRAEVAAILNKINGFNQTAEISFTDVSISSWYHEEIQKAVHAGYVAGYNDNTFRPQGNITREEVSVIINNIYKLSSSTDTSAFNDSSEISSWSRDSVDALVSAGVMNGYPDGTFRPKQPVTRAEVIAILNSVINKNADTDSPKEEIKTPEEVILPAVIEPSKSTTSGGGGSSSGTKQPSLSEQEINKKLQNVVEELDSDVMRGLETDAQIKAAQIMSSSIKEFLSNDDYDISSDVQDVKDIVNNMSSDEKDQFEDIILIQIDFADLTELNKKFNLKPY